MPIKPDQLPTDVATLQAMVLAQDAELAAARAGIIEQRFEIEALTARLARLLRLSFGRSSEKLRSEIEQLELTLADIDERLAEASEPVHEDSKQEAKWRDEVTKPARRPLPTSLPRDVIEHAAPCACPNCGGALRPLGEDVTEILDYMPGSFRVIRHVRPKLSCRRARPSRKRQHQICRSDVAAPVPACWPTCWLPSIPIIGHYTGKLRSMPARGLISAARHWPPW